MSGLSGRQWAAFLVGPPSHAQKGVWRFSVVLWGTAAALLACVSGKFSANDRFQAAALMA